MKSVSSVPVPGGEKLHAGGTFGGGLAAVLMPSVIPGSGGEDRSDAGRSGPTGLSAAVLSPYLSPYSVYRGLCSYLCKCQRKFSTAFRTALVFRAGVQ